VFKRTIAAGLAIASAATAAPVPGEESGIVTGDGQESSTGTEIARGALWVPKGLWWFLNLAPRGIVYVYDRYQLHDWYYRIFYTEDHNISVVPVLEYATGLGLTGGLRFEDRNVFGDKEYLTAAYTYGGTYRMRSDVSMDSGYRFDPVTLKLGGNFDRFDPLPFYGIGNIQDLSPVPAMPVEPTAIAVKTNYRYQEARVYLDVDWRIFDDLHVAARGWWAQIKTSPTTRQRSVQQVYDENVTGFDDKMSHLYGEGEVRLDRRHRLREPWETSTYTTGSMVRGFGGYLHQLDNGINFWHYGVDVQQFIHLTLAPRMFVVRFWGEGVTGGNTNVPFYELPYLGGDFLRGYSFARFRDSLSAMVDLEYVWDLSRFADMSLFAETGRVWDSWSALTLSGLNADFGLGIGLHDTSSFVLGGSLAVSIEGNVNVTATFTSRWNAHPRWR
jgi:outer membrane protein assembly factor BamA